MPKLSSYFATSYYQPVGSIMFLDKINVVTKNTLMRQDSGQAIAMIYQNQNLWNYFNSKGSHCDFYGKLIIEKNDGLIHRIAGNINIADEKSFKEAINNENVSLISSTFLTTASGFTSSKDRFLNVFSYTSLPLISYGRVISKSENLDGCRFDSETRLINKDGKYYAPIFDTDSANHLFKSNYETEAEYLQGKDDLDFSFQEVEVSDANKAITLKNSSSDSFILYKGCYIPATSFGDATATASAQKFCGLENTKYTEKTTFKFNADNGWDF